MGGGGGTSNNNNDSVNNGLLSHHLSMNLGGAGVGGGADGSNIFDESTNSFSLNNSTFMSM